MVYPKSAMILFATTAAALLPATSASAAPPIAYALGSGLKSDLYLVNPNGSGKTLLYSSPNRTNIGIVDMNPAADQLVVVESGGSGFKLIDYSGAKPAVTSVNDGCRVQGIDFHPSDGSLIVSRWCQSQNSLEVRRWNGSYDSQPLVTFGSPVTNAIGTIRWLGDGTGFLIAYANTSGSRIQRHMLGTESSPVTIISWSSAAMPSAFDVARCSGSFAPPCWKFLYDDGAGQIHQIRFDSMSTYDDGVVQAGRDGHYSPVNSQILYRQQSKTNTVLKIGNQVLVSKGDVGGNDWRP